MSPANTQLTHLPTPTTSSMSPSVPVVGAAESPDYIPRPRNAFIIFRADRSKHYQGRTAGDISQLVAAEWKALPAEVRAGYERQADEEKQIHKVMYPHYRFQPKQKPKTKTRDQEERKKIEVKVAEKREQRRAQKRAARAKAKKKRDMERMNTMQQVVPIPVPLPLAYPPRFDTTSQLHFIFVPIPNPAYVAQAVSMSNAAQVVSASPTPAPSTPHVFAESVLDSGPATPTDGGSPIRPTLDIKVPTTKEIVDATATSPLIASASPVHRGVPVDQPGLDWPAPLELPLICDFMAGSTESSPAAVFDWSIPPLSHPDFSGSFYANSVGSTSSLQLSEAPMDPVDWSAVMAGIDNGFSGQQKGDLFKQWDSAYFDTTYPTPFSGFGSPSEQLSSSTSHSIFGDAGCTHQVAPSALELDGLITYDGTFDLVPPTFQGWDIDNCLGLQNEHI